VTKQMLEESIAAIALEYFKLNEVVAVVMSGSMAGLTSDQYSDIDLYVYSTSSISLDCRQAIAEKLGVDLEIGNDFWEPGDEWRHQLSGILVDVMFRTSNWAEDEVDRVLTRSEASVGYSTCFLHSIANSHCLFEKYDWFTQIQSQARQPYPEKLRINILSKNYPILSRTHSSYRSQLEKAALRKDLVSINHRVTAFLASYFDIIFALNYQTHPGEKQLVHWVNRTCNHVPHKMKEELEELMNAMMKSSHACEVVNRMTANLDKLLDELGFDGCAI